MSHTGPAEHSGHMASLLMLEAKNVRRMKSLAGARCRECCFLHGQRDMVRWYSSTLPSALMGEPCHAKVEMEVMER